ncbi:hypothetical protein AWB81_08612 [Caballeronia arationis]|nr:hypothetical protein AWB81_08612 [Caballeronia arationis]
MHESDARADGLGEFGRMADRLNAGVGVLDGNEQMLIHGVLRWVGRVRELICIVVDGCFARPSPGGRGARPSIKW